jgi:predicted CXXCH cytochrome family protein
MKRHWRWVLVAVLVLCFGIVAGGAALAAGPDAQTKAGDESCLACHSNPNLTYKFPSGETWKLYVDKVGYEDSIHTQKGLTCASCHPNVSDYPHKPVTVTSVRAYQLDQYRVCQQCHTELYAKQLDSVHGRALAGGNTDAAICTDCHNSHDTTDPDKPRTKIALACAKCHAAIYDEYKGSVHGKALIDANNTDVPTCTDCHGVHNQEDPTTARFRLNSPQLCAKCHANRDMMAKYGLSTNVFNTYVADFHGTTVTLFEHISPDVPTNKPVCYDCHGVHNMQSTKGADPQVIQKNLLKTCQKCHPDAQPNFSASWLSHYEPRIDKYPLVFFVNLFYMILIPAVLGFMVLFVALDAGSHIVRRLRGANGDH